MPNWCSNHITVRGTDPVAIKRLADAFDAGEFCGTVVPMPEELNITSGRLGDGPEQRELDLRWRTEPLRSQPPLQGTDDSRQAVEEV